MIDSLHTDYMRVSRVVKSTNEYGRTIQDWEVIYDNVKCRLSRTNLGKTNIGAVNTSTSLYKIFVDPKIEIKQNDRLLVIKNGQSYIFKASKPMIYGDFIPHQEIAVEEIEENES